MARDLPARRPRKRVTSPTKRTVDDARDHVLVLRTCSKDMVAHGGFVWPVRGPVAAPDWQPTKACGNGLHGLLWGEGDGSLLSWDPTAKWLVVRVLAADIVNLDDKVKFPAGEVVLVGTQLEATAYIAERATGGKAITGHTATAGDRGTATAGYSGIATAGDSGTATAGDSGVISVRWWDGEYRLAIGYVGEDGILANTAYRCDDRGRLVKA